MTTLLPARRNNLQLGPFQLHSPFVQAALSGYSDAAMRRLARSFGASYALAEVMLDRFAMEVKGTGKTRHHLHLSDDDHPVGGQLMGADPTQFGPAAQRLAECGFDVIDINFGCPVRTAMGGCRGGYHLSQPEVALEIIDRVRNAVPAEIPVTVKMRRGIDDSQSSRDNFFAILDGAFARGVAAITVHGRTVEQKYVGPSRWDFLREVKSHVGQRTILGSGDLFTAEDCVRMLEQTGVDGVTIARGAIGNPWIFSQCQALWDGRPSPEPPTVHQQRDVLGEHARLLEELHGPDRWLGQMRKFSYKYARFHPCGDQVRNAFARPRTPEEWRQLVAEHYAEDRPGQFPEPGDSGAN